MYNCIHFWWVNSLNPGFILFYTVQALSYIAFAGAAWTDRPVIQMLSPAIPCHYHNTDLNMEGMLLRHLGALQRAIHSLEAYYSKEISLPVPSPMRNPTHPYLTSFTSGDNSEKHFKYLLKLKVTTCFSAKCMATVVLQSASNLFHTIAKKLTSCSWRMVLHWNFMPSLVGCSWLWWMMSVRTMKICLTLSLSFYACLWGLDVFPKHSTWIPLKVSTQNFVSKKKYNTWQSSTG